MIAGGYCQTWIWIYVYVRIVLNCSPYKFGKVMNSLTSDESTQLITIFWKALYTNNLAPLEMNEILKNSCKVLLK